MDVKIRPSLNQQKTCVNNGGKYQEVRVSSW